MIIVVWFIVWIVLDLLRQLQVETFEFDFNVLFIFPNNNIIFFYYELTGVLCTYSYVGYLIIRNLTNDFRLVFSFLVNLSSRHDNETDQVNHTHLDARIDTISKEITATRNTLNLFIAEQQQGKFPLSFSFFPR